MKTGEGEMKRRITIDGKKKDRLYRDTLFFPGSSLCFVNAGGMYFYTPLNLEVLLVIYNFVYELFKSIKASNAALRVDGVAWGGLPRPVVSGRDMNILKRPLLCFVEAV